MEFENFEKVPPEKRRAIINAGFTCFSRAGYQKTAMSEIAVAAGVSKAALFHYFGTKKDLYCFLFKFSCDEISDKIPQGSSDFFECIGIGTQAKLAVIGNYPGMYDFLVSVVKNIDAETEDLLREANAHAIDEGVKTLFANVEWSRFKPEVSRQDAISMVTWISEGYLRDNADKPQEMILWEIRRYLDLLKLTLYREEYL